MGVGAMVVQFLSPIRISNEAIMLGSHRVIAAPMARDRRPLRFCGSIAQQRCQTDAVQAVIAWQVA